MTQDGTDEADEAVFPAPRRVVPVDRTLVRDGVALTLVAVEDHADGFVGLLRLDLPPGHPALALLAERRRADDELRRRLLAEHGDLRPYAPIVPGQSSAGPPTPLVLAPYPVLAAWDDRGRQYAVRYQGGGSADGGSDPTDDRSQAIRAWGTPALDTSVRRLSIEVAAVAWRPPPGPAGQPAARVEPGPWAFAIGLAGGPDGEPAGP